MPRIQKWLSFFSALLVMVGTAYAQEKYPSKPIKLIVPLNPGGVNDQIARAFAAGMSETLGQQVLIENRGGASGVVGANLVAKAPPDGYTLCFCFSAPVTLVKYSMGALPYDIDNAFKPVTRVFDLIPMITVPASSPYSSLTELLKAAKENPGMAYGHTGTGGALHLGFELLLDEARVDMTEVGYPGENPIVPDLATGRLTAGTLSALFAKRQAAAGRVKILASMGSSSPVPGVPTVAELGFPGFHVASWSGFFLPAGTPEPIVQKLYTAIQRALSDPEIRGRLTDAGLTPVVGQTPEQFAAFIAQEKLKWDRVVKKIGGLKKN